MTLVKILRKMIGNNTCTKLDFGNAYVHEILTSMKGRNSIKILQKMMGNNTKLDLVNVDVHTYFGQILSIRSQNIEQ